MTDAEKIARLERRVKALEAALDDAIDFIIDQADTEAGPDGEDVPNEALSLGTALTQVLNG